LIYNKKQKREYFEKTIIKQLKALEKEIDGVDQECIDNNPTHILGMFTNIKEKINQIAKGKEVYKWLDI
jgi:hypothetical protein